MARTLISIETCDLCKKQGLPQAEAQRSVHLSIDGPPKRYELCPPHLAQLRPFWELYADEEYGVDESLKPKKRATKKQATPELTDYEPDHPRQLETAAGEPAPQEQLKAQPGEQKSEDQIMVTCSLPHPTGKDVTVQYRSRNSHAKEMHGGLKTWDIEWGDPGGALTHHCETHAQCMKVKLAFPSAISLSRHIRMCPLEKIPGDDLENIA